MRKLIYGALALSAAMAVGFGANAGSASAAIDPAPADTELKLNGNKLEITVRGSRAEASSAAVDGKVYVGIPKFKKGTGDNSAKTLMSVANWDAYDYHVAQSDSDDAVVTLNLAAYQNTKDNYLMIKFDTTEDKDATLVRIPKSTAISKAEYNAAPAAKEQEAEITIKNGSKTVPGGAAVVANVISERVFYYTATGNSTMTNDPVLMAPDSVSGKGSATTADGKYLFSAAANDAGATALADFQNSGATVYFYVADWDHDGSNPVQGGIGTAAATNVGGVNQQQVGGLDVYMGSYEAADKFAVAQIVQLPKRASKSVKVTIPKRPNAPTVRVDYVNGTIKIPANSIYAFYDQYDSTVATTSVGTIYKAIDSTRTGTDTNTGVDLTNSKNGAGGSVTTPTSSEKTIKVGDVNTANNQVGLPVFGKFYLDIKGKVTASGKYKGLLTKEARILFNNIGSTTLSTITAATDGENGSLPITVLLKYNKRSNSYDTIVSNHSIQNSYKVRVATESQDYAIVTLGKAKTTTNGSSKTFKEVTIKTIKTVDLHDKDDFPAVEVWVQQEGDNTNKTWLKSEIMVEKTEAGEDGEMLDKPDTTGVNEAADNTYKIDNTGNGSYDFTIYMPQTSAATDVDMTTITGGSTTINAHAKVFFNGLSGTGYDFSTIGTTTKPSLNYDKKVIAGSKIIIKYDLPNPKTADNQDGDDTAIAVEKENVKKFIEGKIKVIDDSGKDVTMGNPVYDETNHFATITIVMPSSNIKFVKKS